MIDTSKLHRVVKASSMGGYVEAVTDEAPPVVPTPEKPKKETYYTSKWWGFG